MPVKKSSKSEKSNMPYVKGDPIYKKSIQAGWSPQNKHFVGLDGRFTTRQAALEQNVLSTKEAFGGRIEVKFPTPISSQYEILEVNMSTLSDPSAPMKGLTGIIKAAIDGAGGYEERMQNRFNAAVTAEKNRLIAVEGFDPHPESKPMANFMPMQIKTKMDIAEHFCNTDGDVAEIVYVPIELLARDVTVDCPDPVLRDEIDEFIKDHNLCSLIGQLWATERQYGQAYPLEVWDESGKNLEIVIPVSPKSTHIGYNWAYGLSADAIGASEWTESLIESTFPPAMFKILMRHWNDSPISVPGQGICIPGDVMKPIFDRHMAWQRYSMPMVSRGFRELVTRTIYEDSVRAIVEGMRYQMWVVQVGDKDNPASPQEIAAIKSALGASAGERTSMFLWKHPISVEVHTPKGLDDLLGNDYWGALTKQFYRKMGMTSHVVSGETPGTLGSSTGHGSGGSGDMDTKIFTERVRYQSRQVTDWLTYLCKKWAKANSKPVKALGKLQIRFSATDLEMADNIKNIFGPMYRDGALSHRTYVGAAGLIGENEIKQKEFEKKHMDVLMPPATFSQVVVNPSGDVQKKVTQTEPSGSPDKPGEQVNDLRRKAGLPIKDKKQDVVADESDGIGFAAMHGHQLVDTEQEE